VGLKGAAGSENPDEGRTAGSEATEDRSESRDLSRPGLSNRLRLLSLSQSPLLVWTLPRGSASSYILR
jgi:hypothetical protein